MLFWKNASHFGMIKKIKKILIPNRGEIAVRIIKTASRMGIETVVMLHQKEADTLPAKLASEVYWWAYDDLDKTYLNSDEIVKVAKNLMVNAIHPGYGFLSENEKLAIACRENDIIFVGPLPHHLQLMGNKISARKEAISAGVPVIPAWEVEPNEIHHIIDQLIFPVVIKASHGGGGKGMIIVQQPEDLEHRAVQASRESKRYFGNEAIFIEQYFPQPRHIEVQILADQHGNIVHLYERECSIQRRYQKIIEEAPATNLPDDIRMKIIDDALRLVNEMKYENAGTIEFLLDREGNHYFLEMNTRIQVEHPVTESITGIDIVEEQINIAQGFPLSFNQEEIKLNGHAIEARLYAESPNNDFTPSPGQINAVRLPDNCRVETFLDYNNEIYPDYDPMIAKIIVHENTRRDAIIKLTKSLKETAVIGVNTNLSYLIATLNHKTFTDGRYNTSFVKNHHREIIQKISESDQQKGLLAYSASKLYQINKNSFWRILPQFEVIWKNQKHAITFKKSDSYYIVKFDHEVLKISDIYLDKQKISFKTENDIHEYLYLENKESIIISIDGVCQEFIPSDWLPLFTPDDHTSSTLKLNSLNAPIPGKIVLINVKQGDEIKIGETLVVLEAMKMENHLKAWKNGIIKELFVKKGKQVKSNEILLTIQ